MELIPCTVVESSCLPTHNIVLHISWHDPPYRRTTKRFEDSLRMEAFLFPPRKFAFQTWFCSCEQYLCLFHIVFEYTPGIHDLGKMLVLPNQLLYGVLSTSEQCFHSFQPILCHPQIQTRITLFHGLRISILNVKLSHNRTSKGFFQIPFPITVLPKDDYTDFAQEERLGLPYWTMIWAICVVVDESKCLDIPIWEFSIILVHLLILTCVKEDTASAACPAQPGSLEMISMTFAAVICDAEDPCSVNTAWDPESSLQYHLGAQLYLNIFGVLPPIRHSSNDRCPSVKQNELMRPSSLLHLSPPSYFWLSSGSTPGSFQLFPIPCPLLLLLREFSWLGA